MSKKTLTILILIIAAMLIIASVIYWQKTKESPSDKTKAPVVTIPLEPETVYKRGGKILSIDKEAQTIIIESRLRTDKEATTADHSNAFEIKKFTIKLDENTKYISRDFSNIKSGDPVPEPRESSFTELKVGDTVNVTGVENVKGKDEFVAREVEIVKS